MKRIFIGILNQGTIVNGLAQMLCLWARSQTQIVVPFISPFNLPMEMHRNAVVREFLKTNCDILWWIDDDVIPPPNALDRLVGHDLDIVTATAFSTRTEKGILYPYPITLRLESNAEYQVMYGEGVYECDAVGGGAVMVKRAVYEHLDMKRPYIHKYKDDGTMGMTCDFTFCQRAKAAGFKIFADADLICDHIKEIGLKAFNDCLVATEMQVRQSLDPSMQEPLLIQ